MMITAQMVKDLRESTGAGMTDCKNALTEAVSLHQEEKAVMEAAVEILRKKGIAKAAKRLDRETSEGRIVAKAENNRIIIFSLTCETDFVSRNENFESLCKQILNHAWNQSIDNLESLNASVINGQTFTDFIAEKTGSIGEKLEIKHYYTNSSKGLIEYYVHSNFKVASVVEFLDSTDNKDIHIFAKDLAMHITAMKPIALNKNSVPQTVLDKELEIIKEQLRNEGKAENMLEKISAGKLQRFFKDNCLLEQSFVKSEDGKSVELFAADLAKKFNTKIEIKSFTRLTIGE